MNKEKYNPPQKRLSLVLDATDVKEQNSCTGNSNPMCRLEQKYVSQILERQKNKWKK